MKSIIIGALLLLAATGGQAITSDVEMSCTAVHAPSNKMFYASGLKWTGAARARALCTSWAKANHMDENGCSVTCEPVMDPGPM